MSLKLVIKNLRIKNLSWILKLLIFSICLLLLIFSVRTTVVFAITAQECLDVQDVNSLSEGDQTWCDTIGLPMLSAPIAAANQTNQKNLSSLQSQLAALSAKINSFLDQLKKDQADINSREESMAYTQEIFNQKVKDQYTFLRLYDPITPFLFADSASQAFQEIALRQKAADADRQAINQYASDLTQLKNDEDTLQKNKDALTAVQQQVSAKEKFLAGQVAQANAYLATISAKQEAFIAAKLASLGLSRSAYNLHGGCSSDISPYKAPNFSGTEFGFFTFGVPNRIGLDQFGAKGRAEQGQLYPQILSAYYNADMTTGNSQSIMIHVVGRNEFGESIDKNWTVEEYLTHLYEMPTNFPVEALRAQAIAARSYVLAYTNNGAGSICPSQQCQVVKLGAHDSNDAWSQAVRDTAGMVLKNGGQPIKAWFSATHGGYEYTSADIGWSSTPWTKRLVDTTNGNAGSFSDLMNNAYDKSSPVFYCDWGGRSSENKTAWLSSSDLADIVNAVLLVKKDGSTKSHLYQTDKPNPEGTDTWDSARVRSELGGSAFNSVSDVTISVDFGTGRTTSVTVSGDAATQTINGDDFKNYFNLRAPANIQIVGPLFNIEKR